jgi:hypothetical protein
MDLLKIQHGNNSFDKLKEYGEALHSQKTTK